MRYYHVIAVTPLGTFQHWVTDIMKSEFIDDNYPYASSIDLAVTEISRQQYIEATK